MSTKGVIQFRGSDPVSCDLTGQIHFGKEPNQPALDTPSVDLVFPKLSVSQLPRFLSHDIFREGSLTGKLSVSESLRRPKISGSMELSKARLGKGPLHGAELSGRLTFKGAKASVDTATVTSKNAEVSFHGELDFSDPNAINAKLFSARPLFDLTPAEASGCLGDITLLSTAGRETSAAPVDQIYLSGDSGQLSVISLQYKSTDQIAGPGGTPAIRAFLVCSGDEKPRATLTLASEAAPKISPPRKRPKRRQ
jgi:hypothetical protein